MIEEMSRERDESRNLLAGIRLILEEMRDERRRADERFAEWCRKQDEWNRKADEDRRKADEDRRKADEDRRKADEDRRKADEDRRKADEDRRKADEDRRKADEDRKQFRRFILGVGKFAIDIRKTLNAQTEILKEQTRAIRKLGDASKVQTDLLRRIAAKLDTMGNGLRRGRGNGRSNGR